MPLDHTQVIDAVQTDPDDIEAFVVRRRDACVPFAHGRFAGSPALSSTTPFTFRMTRGRAALLVWTTTSSSNRPAGAFFWTVTCTNGVAVPDVGGRSAAARTEPLV